MLCNSKLTEQRTKVDESKLILLSCVRLEIWLHNGIYCIMSIAITCIALFAIGHFLYISYNYRTWNVDLT